MVEVKQNGDRTLQGPVLLSGGEVIMKKLVVMSLLAMTLVLAACGKKKEEAAEGAAQTQTEETQEPAEEVKEEAGEAAEEETAEAAPETEEAEEAAPEVEPDIYSDPVVLEDAHYETDVFSVDLPEEWVGKCLVQQRTHTVEDEYGLEFESSFYQKDIHEKEEGGFLASVRITQAHPMWVEYLGADCIGRMTDPEGNTWYASVEYPTDVQFGPEDEENYMPLYEQRLEIAETFAAAEGWTLERMSYAEVMADYERTFDGVVLDAAMNSAVFMAVPEAALVHMSYMDVTDRSRLAPVSLGHVYHVTYTGVISDTLGTDAKLVAIEDADADYDYDADAAAMAGYAVLAVEHKNLAALAPICDFPVEVDDKEIASEEEFCALNFDDVFSEELARFVRYADLTEVKSENDEAVVSVLPEYSHLLLKKVDGEWKIKGFYNIPTDF